MNETKRKLDFFYEFMDAVEQKGRILGSRQTPFLQEVLPYINSDDEPAIIFFGKKEFKIQLNGYLYQEDTNTLNLYVVEYKPYLEVEDELPETSMTALKEYANMAKRFFTNAQAILQKADRSMEYYDVTKMIIDNKDSIEEINIYVVTSKFYASNKPIDLTITGVETVNVHVWDMDRIFKLSEAEQGIKEFDIHFKTEYQYDLQMMRVPSNNRKHGKIDCFIGVISAQLLAKLYDDWGPKLVERNVRSFLQARGGTNKGIRDTLKDSEQKELFIAYNNGISSVAKAGDLESIGDTGLYRIKTLTSWQIVNGGQTTASIHQAYKTGVDLSGVYVQAKLTIINVPEEIEADDIDRHVLEDDMISKISEYANTQNKINKSDLLANTRFMSDLEKLSRNVWIPTNDNRKEESKWYFERARGQYMVDIGRRIKGKEQTAFKKMYPKENVITKVEMAKYFMSWEGYPHISSKGGEEAFKRFMDMNSQYWKQSMVKNDEGEVAKAMLKLDSDYYKKIIAKRIINAFVTKVVESMNLKGYKANVIYYSVAMLKYLYGKEICLEEVWQYQTLSDKWEEVIRIIANNALNYLKESAGDQNVTQWAKKEDCWRGFIEESSKVLSNLV
ncbi:AIPR family protein [Lysinibacillus sp. HST-98]|uniref:AIPR family protein n=1 Tax=Lysinibacillus TaxID=400634 RepID=UPI001925FDDB|nr:MULTISPECIES: AIPR family protein [Lysinibacillus]MBL3731667.1 AIPR family protein [Lysinibacillus sp. HST-98]